MRLPAGPVPTVSYKVSIEKSASERQLSIFLDISKFKKALMIRNFVLIYFSKFFVKKLFDNFSLWCEPNYQKN